MPKLPAGHFLGRTLTARALAGVRLTEAAYEAGLKLPRHSHELAKYCFVLAGSFVETIGTRAHLRQSLTLAFQPAVSPWIQAVPSVREPWFVSGLENLKAISLVESLLPFRLRKLFVLQNFRARLVMA